MESGQFDLVSESPSPDQFLFREKIEEMTRDYHMMVTEL
jgi:hypothetical protein